MRWSSGFAVCALLAAMGAPSGAHAAPAGLVLDDESAVLAEQEGGGWTTSVGLTNLTDADIELVARPVTRGTACEPTLDQNGSVPAAHHRAFEVTIPAACEVKKDRFTFTVAPSADSTPATTFRITAAAEPKDEAPDWRELQAFLIALGVAALLALALLLIWGRGKLARATEPLPYLDSGWSFTDSWVSNVTIGGGLLTGLFGSSGAIEPFLGDEAEAALALTTVGAAIAVVCVGAGGLVLQASKSRGANAYTVGGLLVAAAITLAGAAGELWVVYASARDVSEGDLHDIVLPVAIVAGLLLLGLYAWRSLSVTLEVGSKEPPDADYDKPPYTETIYAARLIAAAVGGSSGDAPRTLAEVTTAVDEESTAARPRSPAAAAGATRHRRTLSAML